MPASPAPVGNALEVLRTKRRFLVRAKPNAKKTELLGYDVAEDMFTVAVKAPPVDGKANAEIERYFSKLLKTEVVIKTGSSSKTKLLEIKQDN